MSFITKKLLNYANEEKRSLLEIMHEFKIDKKKVETLRRGLKKEGVILKDNRGRPKETFGDGEFIDLVKIRKLDKINKLIKEIDGLILILSADYSNLSKKINQLNRLVG